MLFVHAAPREAGSLAAEPRVLELGVGKVAATLALTQRVLARRPAAVVLFGVAGSHPGGPAIARPCLVEADWLADEGVWAPGGFLSLEQLGLGRRGPFVADPQLGAWVEARLGVALPRVVGATVSACSGTDAQVRAARAACPEASVESMEGAAVGAVCAALGIPWVQLRVISNRTGDRDRAGWDLDAALAVLHPAVRRLLDG
ncbi:MAG: futalosine hydrolase [Myxococcales bacterium]|nr:futalosine hydrolase [Myxococcales bacterium]MCB9712256.1 futalosine hydrolase [Myxococcales bacterium]